MKIFFLGRTQMLMRTIELFEKTEHSIVGIGTCKAAEEYLVNENDFMRKAEDLAVPFFCNSKINSQEIHELLVNLHADIAISINWLTLISDSTMKLFHYGILNGHAGDLPRYRGNACPNWAIINGEKSIGVSVHFMEADELDSGDVVVKEYIPVTDHTTIGMIYKDMEILFPKMFLQAVNKIEELGERAGITQSKKKEDILRCYPRIPSDSCIDWNNSCIDINRLIRASGYPFRGAYTFLNGTEKLYILEADVLEYKVPSSVVYGQVVYRNCEKDCIGIAAKDGIVMVYKLCDENRRPYKVTDKVKSMRDRMGIHLPDKVYELMKELETLKKRIKSHEC